MTNIELLNLGKDWALIQVVIRIAGETVAYRQTRLYQQTSLGWVRVAPTTEHWGTSHQLESRYFIFHYFTPDAAAVEAAADRLDLLYPTLYATFFPEPPDTHKLVVSVEPTLAIWRPCAASPAGREPHHPLACGNPGPGHNGRRRPLSPVACAGLVRSDR